MARPGLSASRDRPVSGRSAVIWLSFRTASSNPAASSPNVPARKEIDCAIPTSARQSATTVAPTPWSRTSSPMLTPRARTTGTGRVYHMPCQPCRVRVTLSHGKGKPSWLGPGRFSTGWTFTTETPAQSTCSGPSAGATGLDDDRPSRAEITSSARLAASPSASESRITTSFDTPAWRGDRHTHKTSRTSLRGSVRPWLLSPSPGAVAHTSVQYVPARC
jgi:hypothetical protein